MRTSTVVGYQGSQQYKFTIAGPTFTPVDGSEAQGVKLGAISANSQVDKRGRYDTGWGFDGDLFSFFDATGKQGHYYRYLPQCLIDADEDYEGKTAGWYDNMDLSYTTCLNNDTIPFGQGVYVAAPSQLDGADPQLIYAGQVKASPTETPAYKFTLIVNPSPVQITLGQISANSQVDKRGRYDTGWDFDGDLFSFFDATGKQGHYYRYLPQCLIDADDDYAGKTAGWYDNMDLSYTTCLNADTMEPGRGIYVAAPSQLDGADPTLIFPSALPQEEAAE